MRTSRPARTPRRHADDLPDHPHERVRAYAEEHGMPESEALAAGMREKTEEFAHRGGRIYLPLTEE